MDYKVSKETSRLKNHFSQKNGNHPPQRIWRMTEQDFLALSKPFLTKTKACARYNIFSNIRICVWVFVSKALCGCQIQVGHKTLHVPPRYHIPERKTSLRCHTVATSQGLPIFRRSCVWDRFWILECPPCYHSIAVPSTVHGTTRARPKYSILQKNPNAIFIFLNI